MPRRKKHSPEEIVTKLRQVELLTGQGTPVGERLVCPLLLIGLGPRSWSRRWTRVSTVIGGHSVAGIDAASAQVPPLER